MSDTILRISLILFKTISITTVAIALVLFLNVVISSISIVLNASVLGDIVAIIQIWTPFNIGVILNWLIAVSGLYLTYRMALLTLELINKYFE